ncbi:hypothetical protein ISN45_Aa06g010990, partial [Arabidopsis thaliana x Arabidopsis arenosa]
DGRNKRNRALKPPSCHCLSSPFSLITYNTSFTLSRPHVPTSPLITKQTQFMDHILYHSMTNSC